MASLQSAEQGSRELDILVSFVLGDTSNDAGKMIHLLVEEGYPWDVISELLDEDLAPYSGSLDAAVPGEHIVMTVYSPRRAKWGAVHLTGAGEHVIVWAATEPLARRAAALKALRPDLRRAPDLQRPKAADETESRPVPADAERRATAHERAGEAGGDTEGEWKILF